MSDTIMCTLCGERPAYAAIWSWCRECTALQPPRLAEDRKYS